MTRFLVSGAWNVGLLLLGFTFPAILLAPVVAYLLVEWLPFMAWACGVQEVPIKQEVIDRLYELDCKYYHGYDGTCERCGHADGYNCPRLIG